jgi:hypothetical protein
MPNIVTTSTSSETMSVSPILLRETGTTRLLFHPSWVQTSNNPLRGGFRYQKKGRNETWEEFEGRSITTLHRDEAYELNLNGEDMAVLFSELETIKTLLSQSGHQYGQTTFQLAENNAENILVQVSESENRDFIIQKLRELERNNFNAIENAVAYAKLQTAIDTITTNLSNSDESFWQEYFDNNAWIIQQIFHFPLYYMQGETYVGGKNTRGRQGHGGVATDQLFRNGASGSFAVVEIKPPTAKLTGAMYRGDEDGAENVCYAMSKDLTGGLVQMENQIRVAIENFQTTLGVDFPDINRLDPIGILLIGNKDTVGMNEDKERSFSLFRKAMRGNVIMTYDDLVTRLEIMKSIYEQ